jgi:hypothetical protein
MNTLFVQSAFGLPFILNDLTSVVVKDLVIVILSVSPF